MVAAATAAGIRLVGIDRPGYGLSPPQPGRTIAGWVPEAIAVTDFLDIDRFATAGVSTGGVRARAGGRGALPRARKGAVLLTDMRCRPCRSTMSDLHAHAVWHAPDRAGAEEVAAVFGRAAAAYDTVTPFFARFGARLVELADLRQGERVLDLGAGRGATLIPAARRAGPTSRVLGVDRSEEMVALLRRDVDQLGLNNVSVQRMNAEALAVEPESFDVALSSFVLHLLPHPAAAAGGLLRALRPGGRIAASAPIPSPNLDVFERLCAKFAPRAVRPIPIPFRSDFDLASVLTGAGFVTVRSVAEDIELLLPDEQAWCDWAWSAGMRGLFESLSPADLEQLQREALAEIGALRTPEGLRLRERARFVLAQRPFT